MKPPSSASGIRLLISPDSERMSRRASAHVLGTIKSHPSALIGLATGHTPTRTYQLISRHGARNPRLFESIRILKLDEWGGLAMDDPATCEVYLQREVVGPWQIERRRYQGWNSCPPDPTAECVRIARWLRRYGPMEACVLGLGVNGHLLFNEPAEGMTPEPHAAQLSKESRRHTMLGKSGNRPRFGLTLGMAGILQSRHIILLVSGAKKAQPLKQMLHGPVTPRLPGSFLQLHPNVSLLCDEEAAAELPL